MNSTMKPVLKKMLLNEGICRSHKQCTRLKKKTSIEKRAKRTSQKEA